MKHVVDQRGLVEFLVIPLLIANTGCRAMRRLSLLFLLAATGCVFGGDPSIDGRWSGSSAGTNYSMTVTERDKTVTGSASISAPGVSIALTVTGTHAHPAVSLTLSATGYQSFNFTGNFETDDLITGRLNGSGFVNEQISLLRSPN